MICVFSTQEFIKNECMNEKYFRGKLMLTSKLESILNPEFYKKKDIRHMINLTRETNFSTNHLQFG